MIYRWKISGTLTTLSPLHLGNPVLDTANNEKASDPNEPVVQKTCDFLPATSLKGVLRHWVMQNDGESDYVERLFGTQSGSATLLIRNAMPLQPIETDVFTRTAINRHTLAAQDGHLFSVETIRTGMAFAVSIELTATADDAETDLRRFLAALEGFNAPTHPILLGKNTNAGWGQMAWDLEKVESLTDDRLKEWLTKPLKEGLPWKPLATPTTAESSNPGEGTIKHLAIEISFIGGLQLAPTGADESLARRYRSINGTSFKGAMRSQSERILRTLGLPACIPYEQQSCEPPCLACQLYGSTQASGKLRFTALTLKGQAKWRAQTLIGIDRFTGGVKSGMTTHVHLLETPQFQSQISVTRPLSDAEMGLLQLTLRDLQEGDIHFGLGAARGFGHCRAAIQPEPANLSLNGLASLQSMCQHTGADHV